MDKQTKEELNAWVIKFKKEINRVEELIEEQNDVIDYDCEIMSDLKTDIEAIKTNLQLIKLVMIVQLNEKKEKI